MGIRQYLDESNTSGDEVNLGKLKFLALPYTCNII